MGQYLGVFFANGVVIGSIYALIALGFNVIYSTTGIINFAQGEFVMIGGLTAAWAHAALKLPLPLAVPAGIAAAALVGLISYLVGLRPAKGLRPVTYIIITIALSIVLASLASFIWGTDSYTLPKFVEGGVRMGAGEVDRHSLLVLPVAAACMLALVVFFKFTRMGLNMRACAENREGAKLCGISVARVSAGSFRIKRRACGGRRRDDNADHEHAVQRRHYDRPQGILRGDPGRAWQPGRMCSRRPSYRACGAGDMFLFLGL